MASILNVDSLRQPEIDFHLQADCLCVETDSLHQRKSHSVVQQADMQPRRLDPASAPLRQPIARQTNPHVRQIN
jgi:hypothetical protein